ncbi:hypothetical protein M3Y97_00279900 [Aphelenchoides bicaudatus]|nr:hypothetical protein M3Y97_00279900 [Aphelenchoides bicaudatus]
MPPYEFTVVTRPLGKADLFATLKRAATVLLNHGAVIEDVQSLGHRDLPYRRTAKVTMDPVYTSNYFLFHSHMPIKTMHTLRNVFRNDKDLVYFHAVNKNDFDFPPFECDLAEWLKPPAYRQSVVDLRTHQHLSRENKKKYTFKARNAEKSVPKSFFIAPARK